LLWNVVGALVLIWAGKQFSLQWGRIFGLYLVWYGIGRAFLETIRLDPAELILGIRVNIWGAFAAIVLGVIIVVAQARRHPGAEPGVYLNPDRGPAIRNSLLVFRRCSGAWTLACPGYWSHG